MVSPNVVTLVGAVFGAAAGPGNAAVAGGNAVGAVAAFGPGAAPAVEGGSGVVGLPMGPRVGRMLPKSIFPRVMGTSMGGSLSAAMAAPMLATTNQPPTAHTTGVSERVNRG